MAGFFGFFDYTKPGKGVSKEDVDKHGISLFFDILGRRWGKLILLNLLYVLFSVPAFIINWFVSAFLISMIPGFVEITKSFDPLMVQILNLFISFSMLLVFGSGSASAAMNYIIKKFVDDTHAWIWSDFWDNFKSNFVQGTLAYIINTVVFSLLFISLLFYSTAAKGAISIVLTVVVSVIFVVFLLMQVYVYQIMAGFKLKLKDIYRNAFLLAVGKLPVTVIATAFSFLAMYLYMLVIAYELSIAVIALVFFTFTTFIRVFITNNTIKKYLLEPSLSAEKENQTEE